MLKLLIISMFAFFILVSSADAASREIVAPGNASPALFVPYTVPDQTSALARHLNKNREMAATCSQRYCRDDSDCGTGCDCAHGSLCGASLYPGDPQDPKQ
jgi:hypothetical protein